MRAPPQKAAADASLDGRALAGQSPASPRPDDADGGILRLRTWWLVSDLPPAIRDWEWIDATAEEAAWLGVNGLALNPETCLTDPLHARLVEEVRNRGHNVIEVSYDGPSYLGGSLRCSTQPIRRGPV